MREIRIYILFLLVWAVGPLTAAEDFPLDRLLMKGGAVLLGTIESVDAETLLLATDYAGTLEVDAFQVERVELGQERGLNLPERLKITPPVGPEVAQAAKAKPAPKVDPLGDWKLSVGLNMTGKQGNSDKFDFALRVNSELQRDYDRLNLYGRYAYGTNRGETSADEVVLGGKYTNFLLNKTGIFARQELEKDDFEGLAMRSTSAFGLTYQFRDEKDLRLEARGGVSYRYEDYTADGSADFPGMDLGLDITWQMVDWMRFKGSYTLVPSIRESDSFLFEQDSGFDLPLNESHFWKLRFGVSSQYNNRPDSGREKLDSRFYAELIASWD